MLQGKGVGEKVLVGWQGRDSLARSKLPVAEGEKFNTFGS